MTTHRRGRAVALAATAALAASPLALATSASASASAGQPLATRTHFYTPPPDHGAIRQVAQLASQHRFTDAELVAREATTPQAVWFTSGTPQQVRREVRRTVTRAAAFRAVPTLVAYDVPGRDCSQYSSGGAGSDAAYRAWADGFAGGLRLGQQVVVIVEPDGLANLPSDCPTAYPGQDVAALTAGRIADITYMGEAVEKADPSALVYLDIGHSAWHSVADATSRLEEADVSEFQGFSLNVSNYQWTPNLEQYGTWISDCIALHPDAATTTPTDCGDQYYNGSAASNWAGVALDGSQQWSDQPYTPGSGAPSATNTTLINARYADELGGTRPTAHFVIDTSRNGQGPWAPPAGKYAGDAQTWCNPPGRGLGARPQADPDAAFPLVDAFLWVKTPGQSDGQCNRGVAGSTTDPEWGGITDPAAGDWFPQQALQLAQLAEPPLR